jgi:hypothetical protein
VNFSVVGSSRNFKVMGSSMNFNVWRSAGKAVRLSSRNFSVALSTAAIENFLGRGRTTGTPQLLQSGKEWTKRSSEPSQRIRGHTQQSGDLRKTRARFPSWKPRHRLSFARPCHSSHDDTTSLRLGLSCERLKS